MFITKVLLFITLKKKKLVFQIIILKAKDFDFEQSINGFMFKMPNKNADETTS